MNFMQTHSRV